MESQKIQSLLREKELLEKNKHKKESKIIDEIPNKKPNVNNKRTKKQEIYL